MAREVHEFPVSIPAGTPITAPLTFNLPMPPRIIDEVQVQVPPGPRGEVGFAIGQAGVPIFPFESGAYVVTDNELVSWPLEDANTSGAWQIIAYNSGAFNHTLYVRFFARLPDAAATAADSPPIIESTTLSA